MACGSQNLRPPGPGGSAAPLCAHFSRLLWLVALRLSSWTLPS